MNPISNRYRIRTCAGASPVRCPNWIMYLALAALGINLALGATRELGFSRSVTPGLMQHFAVQFAHASNRHISDWQQLVRGVPAGQRGGIDPALLDAVNTFFNHVPYVSDLTHWGVEDYWASPAEMLASNGADCEDFSIAKYFTLKELGVPIERLRITYVKAVRLNQAHMVLAYYPAPNAVPLILDNLQDEVRPASERADLIPVYSFNDEDVVLARHGQPGASAGSSSQIRLWRSLLDKLEKELLY
jgi:predicted transglutaminase-like cysteine proteinase